MKRKRMQTKKRMETEKMLMKGMSCRRELSS